MSCCCRASAAASSTTRTQTSSPWATAPAPIFVGNFDGSPGLLTVNSGSNDLTLIPDFLHGGPAQEIPSGGTDPVAVLAGDFLGDGRTDLLVANNGDGRLALFLGGLDGLEDLRIFENPDLPNPTVLAMDDLGQIFGVSEGVPAAVQISLRLGGGGWGTFSQGRRGPTSSRSCSCNR